MYTILKLNNETFPFCRSLEWNIVSQWADASLSSVIVFRSLSIYVYIFYIPGSKNTVS